MQNVLGNLYAPKGEPIENWYHPQFSNVVIHQVIIYPHLLVVASTTSPDPNNHYAYGMLQNILSTPPLPPQHPSQPPVNTRGNLVLELMPPPRPTPTSNLPPPPQGNIPVFQQPLVNPQHSITLQAPSQHTNVPSQVPPQHTIAATMSSQPPHQQPPWKNIMIP